MNRGSKTARTYASHYLVYGIFCSQRVTLTLMLSYLPGPCAPGMPVPEAKESFTPHIHIDINRFRVDAGNCNLCLRHRSVNHCLSTPSIQLMWCIVLQQP